MAGKSRVAEILVKAKLVDELQMRAAQASHDQWGGRLGKVVVDMGFTTDDAVADALAKALFLRRHPLGNLPRDPTALAKIDADYADRNAVFPAGMRDNGKTLLLAMADPTDLQVVDEVAMKARCRVITVVAGEREIEAAILRNYRGIDARKAARHSTPLELDKAGFFHRAGEAMVGEDDFQVVDMGGYGVMHSPAELDREASRPEAQIREANALSSARDMLEEILSGPKAEEPQLSPEVVKRLEMVRSNQDKSTRILRALMELLFEKGAVSQQELASRTKS
jgi:hypothetical protein